VKSAKEACIHEEIIQFPEGYQTLVGERGVTLSGGQKQRVSIARALMRHPSLVIFDDCLSAVDASTERTILNNLNVYLRDKTAIIITHRILNLFDFDQIVVLENGSIKEIGSHDTLLALGGYYASLYKKQTQAMEA
jgi:ATP-binding cassette subfamily B protein